MVVSTVVNVSAGLIGTSDSAIKILFTLYTAYPLSLIYRHLLYSQDAWVKHLYFILTGFTLGYFNFGLEVFHSLANILAIYLLLVLAGGSKLSVVLAFTFNSVYLVIGYFFYEGDLLWTMPQCVLTLRLTAIVFDVYDGKKKRETLSADQKISALPQAPSLMELLGICYFYGTFFVGPQYPMIRYLEFVRRKNYLPGSGSIAVSKLVVGTLYIAAFQVGNLLIPHSFMVSDDFQALGFLTKCLYITLWGRIALNKYIGCWIMVEGALVLCGLSYNGVDEKGQERWDGCSNIDIVKLETGCTFHDYIQSFNVQTNLWMAKYIFKRLRFLGNKNISQAATLFYLALWHGIKSGYYMCFFMEFLMTNAEQRWVALISRYKGALQLEGRTGRVLGYWLRKLITTFSWSYALVSFVLLDYELWTRVYGGVYYCLHIFLPLSSVVFFALGVFLFPKKTTSNGAAARAEHVD